MAKVIIFLGTPHRETGSASWGNFATKALKALQMGIATNTSLLADLRKNSETLGQISQQFVERGPTLQMKSFYETIKSDYMNCLVYYLWTMNFQNNQGLIQCHLGCGKRFGYSESAY